MEINPSWIHRPPLVKEWAMIFKSVEPLLMSSPAKTKPLQIFENGLRQCCWLIHQMSLSSLNFLPQLGLLCITGWVLGWMPYFNKLVLFFHRSVLTLDSWVGRCRQMPVPFPSAIFLWSYHYVQHNIIAQQQIPNPVPCSGVGWWQKNWLEDFILVSGMPLPLPPATEISNPKCLGLFWW